MTELRTVKLSELQPNPFRDGGGGTPAATWDSVASVYGYDEQKLEELQQSFKSNGIWPSVIVRETDKGYQLAFGHHRVEAARRSELNKIPVIVEKLTDNDMLKFMAAENSEEYGHDFALGVMNAVEATVKAYGSGLIELERPDGSRTKDLRAAPSFVVGGKAVSANPLTYTALSVGKYLGWTAAQKGTVAAAQKVLAALGALELIELGALRRTQLKGLGQAQARELITITRRRMEAEEEKVELQRQSLEKARERAERANDKRTVATLDKKVEELEFTAPKAVKTAGQAAAASVVNYFREGGSMASAASRAADEMGLKVPAVSKNRSRNSLGDVDGITNDIDRTLKADDPGWTSALALAEGQGDKKTFRVLAEALDALGERVKERSKELKKARGL